MKALASWFWGLSKAGKVAVLLAYLIILGSSVFVIVFSQVDTQANSHTDMDHTDHSSHHETLSAVVEKKIVMKFDEEMPFKKATIKDPTLAEGESYIRTTGVKGSRNVTYEITYSNGIETDRVVLEEEILVRPVDEVKVVGVKKDRPSAHKQKSTQPGR